MTPARNSCAGRPSPREPSAGRPDQAIDHRRRGREHSLGWVSRCYRRRRENQGTAQFSRASEFDAWLTDRSLRATLGLVLAALGVVIAFTSVLRAEEHERTAYESAPVCSATARTGSCKPEVPIIIADKGSIGGKSPTYYLDITSSVPPANGRIDLPAQTALWNAAASGDQASATIWNNAVVNIDDYGTDGNTTDTPGENISVLELVIAAATICVSMFALFARSIDRCANGRFGAADRILPALNLSMTFLTLGFTLGSIVAADQDALADGIVTAAVISAIGFVFILFDARRES